MCIQGFRGQGYSPKFIANLARLKDRLQKDPELQIKVVAGADDICAACPHLSDESCICPDQDVDTLDQKMLNQLGLELGDEGNWESFLDVIRSKMKPGQLRGLCSHCRWRDLDFCDSGLKAIQAGKK